MVRHFANSSGFKIVLLLTKGMRAKNIQYERIITTTIWMLVSVACVVFMYKSILADGSFSKVDWNWPVLNSTSTALLITAILLVFANWGVEAFKWHYAVKDVENIGFRKSLKATMAGMAVSTWMPNRLGEYLGKVFYLPNGKRVKGAISALYASYTQIIATLALGILGFSYFLSLKSDFTIGWKWLIPAVALVVAMIFGYLKLKSIINGSSRSKLHRFIRLFVTVFARYPSTLHWQMIALSVLRTGIFSAQYVLLLSFFGAEISLLSAFFLVLCINGLQTVIPASAVVSLGIRGGLGIFILGAANVPSATILQATYFLWFINLALPSLIGFYFLITAPVSFSIKGLARMPLAFIKSKR
ncbi:MAG: flippase-like domain-containing protein [Bacteroidetes bacterium]|nr:flippase-like domain-containing protein [Bacteroidota bacterium]